MIRSKSELLAMLDALDDGMRHLIDGNPDAGDFWAAFARQADHIDDSAAAEDSAYVHERIDAILTSYGLDPAGWETPDDITQADQVEPTNNR